MNFHKILENDQLSIDLGFAPRESIDADKLVKQMLPKAVCFYLGESNEQITEIYGLKDIGVPNNNPYPVCWFEWEYDFNGKRQTSGMLRSDQHGILACAYFEKAGDRMVLTYIGVVNKEHQGCKAAPEMLLEYSSSQLLAGHNKLIHGFLTALACKNVTKVLNEPDAKLNRSRVKKGKMPIFSYWTLELTGSKKKSDYLGGTHESPRVHMRRGHAKKCPVSDGYYWVQPHVVGNKKLGFVHKDYANGMQLKKAA